MNNLRSSRKRKELLSRFSVLTRLMSKKSDIKIIISGDQPYTTGDLIVLPCGDFNDATYCELLEGIVDHEIGHVDESCFDIIKDFAGCKLSVSILNIIEDVRMERSRCRKYIGSRINFYRMISHLLDRGWFQPVDSVHSAPSCLCGYILYAARFRYMDQDQFKEFTLGARKVLVEKFDLAFVEQLDEILTQIPECKHTAGAGEITRQILDLLDLDKPKKDKSNEASNCSDDDFNKHVKDCLNATIDDVQPDLHEAIKQELSVMVKQSLAKGALTDGDCHRSTVSRESISQELTFIDFGKAKLLSGQVRNTLAKTLHSLSRLSVRHSRRGDCINASRLGGIKAGNLSVFKTETVTRAPNTAISLLIDRSYSMNERMVDTNTSAFALASAFERLKGVKSEVLYYPFYEQNSIDENLIVHKVHCAKSYDDKTSAVKGFFNVEAEGGTPTGSAMQEAVRRLVSRKELRKILFVITDGDSDDPVHVQKEVETALTFGIEVVPIVLEAFVNGFEAIGTIRVDEISQLPSVIKEAVRLKLL